MNTITAARESESQNISEQFVSTARENTEGHLKTHPTSNSTSGIDPSETIPSLGNRGGKPATTGKSYAYASVKNPSPLRDSDEEELNRFRHPLLASSDDGQSSRSSRVLNSAAESSRHSVTVDAGPAELQKLEQLSVDPTAVWDALNDGNAYNDLMKAIKSIEVQPALFFAPPREPVSAEEQKRAVSTIRDLMAIPCARSIYNIDCSNNGISSELVRRIANAGDKAALARAMIKVSSGPDDMRVFGDYSSYTKSEHIHGALTSSQEEPANALMFNLHGKDYPLNFVSWVVMTAPFLQFMVTATCKSGALSNTDAEKLLVTQTMDGIKFYIQLHKARCNLLVQDRKGDQENRRRWIGDSLLYLPLNPVGVPGSTNEHFTKVFRKLTKYFSIEKCPQMVSGGSDRLSEFYTNLGEPSTEKLRDLMLNCLDIRVSFDAQHFLTHMFGKQTVYKDYPKKLISIVEYAGTMKGELTQLQMFSRIKLALYEPLKLSRETCNTMVYSTLEEV